MSVRVVGRVTATFDLLDRLDQALAVVSADPNLTIVSEDRLGLTLVIDLDATSE